MNRDERAGLLAKKRAQRYTQALKCIGQSTKNYHSIIKYQLEHCSHWTLWLKSNRFRFPSMELNFLGNKYTKSNEPKEKSVVQLKYMGKAYQASMSKASRTLTALTYRGVSYTN